MSIDVSLDIVDGTKRTEVFSEDLTGNLTKMAHEAGLVDHLWHPASLHLTHAAQMITPLTEALVRLEAEPEYYTTFNPSNNWGSYAQFTQFVKNYLAACTQYPGAEIS